MLVTCASECFSVSPRCSIIRLSRPLLDCPSNLKEAIDWILRVTGKDGGGGDNGGTAALTNNVKELLKEVKGSGTGLGADIENVKKAFDNGKLITELADGLQQFIGYESSHCNTTGKITGAGIAPSNMATHRLCDATIAFTIGVLEGCKGRLNLRKHSAQHAKIDGVIKSLHDKYGQGPEKLQDVGTQMKTSLAKNNFKQTGLDSFVDDIGTAFQTLSTGINNMQSQPKQVAEKVGEYLKGIFEGSGGNSWGGKAEQAAMQLQALAGKFHSNNTYDTSDNTFSQNIRNVENNLTTTQAIPAVKPILVASKEEFVWHLEKAYVSYYQGTPVDTRQWDSNKAAEAKRCAQIFLGCIPLIYHCLTQFYWLCLDKTRRWDTYPFSGGGLRNLMVALGYGDAFLGGSTGKAVMTSVATKFNELSSAAASISKPYPEFLNTLTTSFDNAFTSSSTLTGQTIPALYHIARLYFRHQQGRNPGKTRPPSSIREMLYWLSGLQFSPQYDSLQSHISGVFRNMLGKPTNTGDTQLSLDVADSASYQNDNKLSAFDLKGYLTMTCLYSPMVLGRLQGHGVSEESKEPYLHHLFGNGMSFGYPSGAALLSKLSEYAYALQFQLSLTQKSFTNFDEGCGWRHCKFGKGINSGSANSPPSHICNGYTCNGVANCKHNGESNNTGGSSGPDSTTCTHNQRGYGSNCGTGSKASPLQAFLTDKLKGFSRGHPSDPSSHLASCSSNSMCHVPMGFKAEYLRETPGYGYHVFYPLLFYCSDNTRPLRLLSDKLYCISNYTPRSLGDMLGFYLHLCLQVFNKRSQNNFTFSSYITDLLKTKKHPSRAGLLIFEYLEDSIVELGSALHGVARHCHNKQKGVKEIKHQTVSGRSCSHSNTNSSPADLWSLFALVDNQSKHPDCNGLNQKCGAYLAPLTRSYGSTFGKSAAIASTYLSWVSYLADDFKESLEGLFTDFSNITCTDCKTLTGGTCSCTKGQHGTNSCQCDSVVSCSGVLPLFYEHGFNFFNVKSLSGKGSGTGNTKRTCQQFHSQLQSVISGNPLTNLLTTIDAFLYAIRWEFFSKLSGFWSIYICLILYTFFFLLDTLRVRSHIKLTSSHTVPPLALLTSGTPLLITKLTYIGK
ncbi:variant erythrocyte surface antigen-1 family protein [Babesia caballi]|uniref:Variant erythrocyte surface antigen-1 family protein n=1 Tax=Babesia caballi TaxID=5871 RepID=A0AAV4LYY0_BABCB|nr:variant erythrocyte surface antigen-1 family protein [Babesia caballi]